MKPASIGNRKCNTNLKTTIFMNFLDVIYSLVKIQTDGRARGIPYDTEYSQSLVSLTSPNTPNIGAEILAKT